jgi:hypothetical protein
VATIDGFSCSSVCPKQVATSNTGSRKTRMANDAAKRGRNATKEG